MVYDGLLPSGIHERMLSVGDQLSPEHRLNESFRTIEHGLRRIRTGRAIHALTIASEGLALLRAAPLA
jgi:hypothetical protein